MNEQSVVHIVDDDEAMRKSLSMLMKSIDLMPRTYESANDFLANYSEAPKSCILMDIRMPEISGVELQALLPQNNINVPVIMMTGYADVPTAVQSMKMGAVDFIEKPFDHELLIDTIKRCIDCSGTTQEKPEVAMATKKLHKLTAREHEIFDQLVEGKINKVIAAELNLSVRTVEAHRAHIMSKLEAKSLSELVKISMYAGEMVGV